MAWHKLVHAKHNEGLAVSAIETQHNDGIPVHKVQGCKPLVGLWESLQQAVAFEWSNSQDLLSQHGIMHIPSGNIP